MKIKAFAELHCKYFVTDQKGFEAETHTAELQHPLQAVLPPKGPRGRGG